jgi:hypothetical protein
VDFRAPTLQRFAASRGSRELRSTPRRPHGWDCPSVDQGDARAGRNITRERFYPLMIAHPTANKHWKRLVANNQANSSACLSPLNGFAALLNSSDH